MSNVNVGCDCQIVDFNAYENKMEIDLAFVRDSLPAMSQSELVSQIAIDLGSGLSSGLATMQPETMPGHTATPDTAGGTKISNSEKSHANGVRGLLLCTKSSAPRPLPGHQIN